MLQINICEIDQSVNKGITSVDVALKKIENHIVEEIDPTFPCEEFEIWVDSDEEKPFRWNKKLYIWRN